MPPILPMLAKLARAIPAADGLLYEPKWDGFRCIVFRDGDEIELASRNQRPFNRYFPELIPQLLDALPERCVVDGEIVVPDADGHGLDFDQKLLDVAKRVTKQELNDENWLRLVARLTDRSYEQMRVMVLEFLETDVFNVSAENCVTFLDPLIESWDIDLATFAMEIVLNRRLAPGTRRNSSSWNGNPSHRQRRAGAQAFLQDPSLSSDATAEEIEFFKEAKIHAKPANPALLLPGAAKPARPAPFSPRRTDVAVGDDSLGADATGWGGGEMTCRTAWAGEQLHDVEAGTPVAVACHALGAVPWRHHPSPIGLG